jgi:hypothetical protein
VESLDQGVGVGGGEIDGFCGDEGGGGGVGCGWAEEGRDGEFGAF